jgi:biotin carboxyl carrier protein
VSVDNQILEVHVSTSGRAARSSARDHDALAPPMSATVVRIAVKPGDRVRQGDLLVALEAMKMELPIRAPRDGVVTAVRCSEGELVQPGVEVLTIE